MIPMAKAIVETISKYSNDFTPIRPTFFKSPIPPIPNTMVRNIIGTIKSFMILINPSPTTFI